MSYFAHAQNLSFENLCKAKIHKDSVQMGIMQSNISRGITYKYHIVQVQRPDMLYRTTYFYPLLEKGLNKEVYRTNSIDMGNMYRNGVYRDSFNRYGAVDMSSAIVNGLLGVLLR